MRLNLPKLLVTAFWILCGVVLAVELRHPWGVPGYIVGFSAGFSAALVVTWAAIVARIRILFPFPVCRQGRCRSPKQFSWRRGTIHGWEGWGVYLYRCKCGDRYIRKGRRFLQLVREGEELPYKRLVGFQTWADDSGG